MKKIPISVFEGIEKMQTTSSGNMRWLLLGMLLAKLFESQGINMNDCIGSIQE